MLHDMLVSNYLSIWKKTGAYKDHADIHGILVVRKSNLSSKKSFK